MFFQKTIDKNSGTSPPASLAGIVACLIWSSAVMVSGELAHAFGGLTAGGMEFGLAGVVLFLIHFWRGDADELFSHSKRYYLVCGFCWITSVSLYWTAVELLIDKRQLIIVGLINYLWPCFTLVGAVIILKKAWNWPLIPGLVLAFSGVVVARLIIVDGSFLEIFESFKSDPDLLSYFLAFLDAIAWALYSIYSRKLATPGKLGAVPVFMLAASIPMIVMGRLSGEEIRPEPWHVALLTTWSVIFASSAYVLWDWGMRMGKVVLITSFSMCIPLFSTAITAAINRVPLTLGLLIASAIVVISAVISNKAVKE